MNVTRIRQAIFTIEKLTPALNWLEEYGPGLDYKVKESFEISFRPIAASACPGAKEAAEQIGAIARLHIVDIIDHAIRDAVNTIDMERDAIREECA